MSDSESWYVSRSCTSQDHWVYVLDVEVEVFYAKSMKLRMVRLSVVGLCVVLFVLFVLFERC